MQASDSSSFIFNFKVKRFLIQVAIFLSVCFFLAMVVFLSADGRTDPFYLRFTSSPQRSLILGTSRAAQGLQPQVLNQVMAQGKLLCRFYNYAFTVSDSPYGPVYLRSVRKKLDSTSRNGCFILAVDPWSISAKAKNPNDSAHFEENTLHLAKVNDVNRSPNLDYLLHAYDEQYVNIIRSRFTNHEMFLHNDGWLEVTTHMDSAALMRNTREKIQLYRTQFLPYYKYSGVRWDYLVKTIRFLQDHGHVYLVRLPVSKEMEGIEDALMPDFENKMDSLSKAAAAPYLSFRCIADQFSFTDGNHLVKEDGRTVSAAVGHWIVTVEQNSQAGQQAFFNRK